MTKLPLVLPSPSFVLTPVTKLATQSATTMLPTRVLYSYFLSTSILPTPDDSSGYSAIMNTDALTLMQSGAHLLLGAQLYLADVMLSSTCLVLGNYALARAGGPSGGMLGCG